MCCMSDLDETNYCEQQAEQGGKWLPSGFCQICVTHLLKTQWPNYTKALAAVTCKAEQNRLLKRGPPINVSDKTAMPCPDDVEVHALWFMSGNEYRSAKLEGSLVGEERQAYWDE